MGEVRRREGEINCTDHYGQSIYIKFQNLHRLLSGIWGQLRLEILRLVYFNKRCYKIGQSNIRKAMLILKC